MSSQKLHFIIIDDSQLDCFITEKVIRNTGLSASVTAFVEATKGLEYIKTTPAPVDGHKSLIIVDIYMPLMNGFEFIEAFERLPDDIQQNYSIFMLSSSINENDLNRVANYRSVKHFMNKPLKSNVLVTLIGQD
jgi:CheY-like chemotaxis protein